MKTSQGTKASQGRKASQRRRRAARALVVLVALFLTAGLYSVASPGQSRADTSPTSQAEHGKALFEVSCASCHGLNAEGSATAPSLIGVGAAAVDFQVSTGRMPLARPEAQAPRKANTFTDDEVAALAAWVASLAPGPAIPSPEQYSPTGLSPEEIARGGELFRTNCSACHNFEGSGGALSNGRYAPTLKGVDNRNIYEALRTGPQDMPVFSKASLPDEDVAQIVGYLNTLHAQPQQGGFGLGALGPVTEGLVGWLVGIGGLVLIAAWIARKGARAR